MLEHLTTLNGYHLYQLPRDAATLNPGQGIAVQDQHGWLMGSTHSHHQLLSQHLLGNGAFEITGSAAPAPAQGALIIGHGLGMASALAISRKLSNKSTHACVMFSDQQFPFTVIPSRIMAMDFADEMIGACPLLEDLGVLSRLANQTWQPGCYHGGLLEWAQQSQDLIDSFEQVIVCCDDRTLMEQLKEQLSNSRLAAIWTPQ